MKENGKSVLIKNVWYVPGMKCNLMSIGQLLQKGFSVTMCDGKLKLFDQQKKLVLRSPLGKRKKTFKVSIQATETRFLSATDVEGERLRACYVNRGWDI